jgi:hypothetical protein
MARERLVPGMAAYLPRHFSGNALVLLLRIAQPMMR